MVQAKLSPFNPVKAAAKPLAGMCGGKCYSKLYYLNYQS